MVLECYLTDCRLLLQMFALAMIGSTVSVVERAGRESRSMDTHTPSYVVCTAIGKLEYNLFLNLFIAPRECEAS